MAYATLDHAVQEKEPRTVDSTPLHRTALLSTIASVLRELGVQYSLPPFIQDPARQDSAERQAQAAAGLEAARPPPEAGLLVAGLPRVA
jgi:hypothetical protein